MPLPEDLTLYIRVWTQQACAACGAEFRQKRKFKIMRRDTYRDDTIEKIEREWTKGARETAEHCPCPHCGWIQPDMAGTAKAFVHGAVTFIGFFLLFLNLMATILFPERIPRHVGSLIAAGLGFAALVFHLDQLFRDPNRHREMNRDDARERIDEGVLQLVKPGGETTATIPYRPQGFLAAIGLALGSMLAFASTASLDVPFILSQPVGIILFIAAGSVFASNAYRLKESALPRTVVEVETTQVFDDSVPADFQRKQRI